MSVPPAARLPDRKKVLCNCSKCYPGKECAISTIRKHLAADLSLSNQILYGHPYDQNHILRCISLNQAYFNEPQDSHIGENTSEDNNTSISSNASLPPESDILTTSESSQSLADSLGNFEEPENDFGELFDEDEIPFINVAEEALSSEVEDWREIDDSGPETDRESTYSSSVATSNLSVPQNLPASSSTATADGFDAISTIKYPQSRLRLQKRLLEDYSCPHAPSFDIPVPSLRPLTKTEELSLQLYNTWKKSNGTIQIYNNFSQMLARETSQEILSLHLVRKLASKLTNFKANTFDMCPRSCISYTGEYEHLISCPHILSTTGKICGEQRYKSASNRSSVMTSTARSQYMLLPIIPSICARFAHAETSHLMRYRDNCLQSALRVVAEARERLFSDFCNGDVHLRHHQAMGLFSSPYNVALSLSSDGAQLQVQKQSDTWLVILILLNLPPKLRYKSNNIIISTAIPGPHSPGNIESFLFPLYAELMRGSVGFWFWDVISSSYLMSHLHLTMIQGDMPGSTKLNGMSGHSAIYGDRFLYVRGARATTTPGAKPQYYPLDPPEREHINPDRPEYNIDALPQRRETDYWSTIDQLQKASSKAAASRISRETGISHMPMAAALAAFVYPSYFPMDGFHIFGPNILPHLWDIWLSSSPAEINIHVSKQKAEKFGALVIEAMATLPPSFSGPVRNPYLKRQSQYKAFEWMASLYWYIIPIGIELEFPLPLLHNFSLFVAIVEFVMTIKARSASELEQLHLLIKRFLQHFEHVYVGNSPEKINRCRICVFQLIHLPRHIAWYGSIRVGSQATCERAIGEISHSIRSKKNPYANLSNIIYECELLKNLCLYYPQIAQPSHTSSESSSSRASAPFSLAAPFPVRKHEKETGDSEFHQQLKAVRSFLGLQTHGGPYVDSELSYTRYGKMVLNYRKATLNSRLSETRRPPMRSHRYFHAQTSSSPSGLIFGEALSFFEVHVTRSTASANPTLNPVLASAVHLVIFLPLKDVEVRFGARCGKWSDSGSLKVCPISAIASLIGIWEHRSHLYVLQPHVALNSMSPESMGLERMEESEAATDSEDHAYGHIGSL